MLNNIRNALCEMFCHVRIVCVPVITELPRESTREERMIKRYEDMERRVDKLYWRPRDTFKI